MSVKRSACTWGLSVLLLVCAGPGLAGEPVKEATRVAEAWLALVDAGDYDKSWDQAAALFKQAVTREQWAGAAAAVRQPLGRKVSRKLKSAQYAETLPGAPDGQYVVIQFETVFAQKKQAVETVTPMRDADGRWRVSGYYVK